MAVTPNAGASYAALLRGINVGGKHKLPMKDLLEVFAETQCARVRTYIQSGNVVFTAPDSVVKRLTPALEKAIEERFGFAVPVILRSREQLAQTVRNNPFLQAGKPRETLHVYFLRDEPQADAIAKLDPARSAPDEFRVLGREIYLFLPDGMARSKLTSTYFDSKLSTVCTARNWATVLKLLEMAEA